MKEYFENTNGTAILATSDNQGNVDAAIYARPHVIDENTVAFIMNDHLSRKNLCSNPKAVYLFMEEGPGYNGKRLYLTKIKESDDQQLIESMRKRKTAHACEKGDTKRFLVYFNIDKVRPLIGD